MKLGEALVKEALITKQQLNQALERQVVFGGRIGTNIVELRFIEEDQLTLFLSKYFKLPAVSNEMTAVIPEEVVTSITKDIADKYKILPFKKERNRLHTAMLNPKDLKEIDELRFMTGFDIIPYVISELRLLHGLEKFYGIKRDLRYISLTDRFDASEAAPIEEPSIDKIKQAFTDVKDTEEIAAILLHETQKFAQRAALFTLKGKKVTGWKAKGMSVEDFIANGEDDSIFSDVIRNRTYYRGPVLNIRGNNSLIKILNGIPQDVLLMPILIREKLIGLLYVDNGNTSVLNANVGFLALLVSMAAVSFEILILKKRILEMGSPAR